MMSRDEALTLRRLQLAQESEKRREQQQRKFESAYKVDEAPCYYPTEEEFQDPVQYIRSIEAEASRFGICKIIPPASWKPSFEPSFNVVEEARDEFNTKHQKVRSKALEGDTGVGFKIAFENEHLRYSLDRFKQAATKVHRFGNLQGMDPLAVEALFWKTVRESNNFSVQYGSDVDGTACAADFGPWSLSALGNLSMLGLIRMSGALDIVGVNIPMMYVGHPFSMFAWHYEDNSLGSINYMHAGAGKTWYGVPGAARRATEKAVRRLFRGRGDDVLRHLPNKCTMLSPDVLRARGVPVFRACQRAGEFVVTFPSAYHSGFSHGFNVGEATNFAVPGWLPHGLASLARHRKARTLSVLDFEKMAFDAVSLRAAARAAAAPPGPSQDHDSLHPLLTGGHGPHDPLLTNNNNDNKHLAGCRISEHAWLADVLSGARPAAATPTTPAPFAPPLPHSHRPAAAGPLPQLAAGELEEVYTALAPLAKQLVTWLRDVMTEAAMCGVGVARIVAPEPGEEGVFVEGGGKTEGGKVEVSDRADGRVHCAECLHVCHLAFLTCTATAGGRAVCPEHVATLRCRRPSMLTLHVRYSPAELDAFDAACGASSAVACPFAAAATCDNRWLSTAATSLNNTNVKRSADASDDHHKGHDNVDKRSGANNDDDKGHDNVDKRSGANNDDDKGHDKVDKRSGANTKRGADAACDDDKGQRHGDGHGGEEDRPLKRRHAAAPAEEETQRREGAGREGDEAGDVDVEGCVPAGCGVSGKKDKRKLALEAVEEGGRNCKEGVAAVAEGEMPSRDGVCVAGKGEGECVVPTAGESGVGEKGMRVEDLLCGEGCGLAEDYRWHSVRAGEPAGGRGLVDAGDQRTRPVVKEEGVESMVVKDKAVKAEEDAQVVVQEGMHHKEAADMATDTKAAERSAIKKEAVAPADAALLTSPPEGLTIAAAGEVEGARLRAGLESWTTPAAAAAGKARGHGARESAMPFFPLSPIYATKWISESSRGDKAN